MPRAYLKKGSFWLEMILRLVLGGLFIYMERLPPFVRYISPTDLETVYKHPRKDSYVPARLMWAIVLLVPPVFFTHSLARRDRYDFVKALAALSLALVINGIITDSVKLIVGRPRPDFFWRCFPDGVVVPDIRCTGNLTDIIDGRKSFPSGHSSFSFCSLGFLSFWLQGRMGVWSARGRGSGPRLFATLVPLGAALGIALSRTCDYHHHWQDVLTGSLLGLGVAYMCYNQNYHPLSSSQSGEPYGNWLSSPGSAVPGAAASSTNGLVSDRTPLLVGDRRETKWI